MKQSELPDANLIFLTSKFQTYHYKQLYGFTKWLHQALKNANVTTTEEHPLLIFADNSDEAIFLIAAAFLLNIPIYPLHPDATQFEINQALERVTPSARFYGNRSPFKKLDEIAAISIQPRHLNIPGDIEPDLFTLDQPGSIAGYFLTSGSTSSPKIVPLKRRQVFAAAEASAETLQPAKERYWLLCLPLNHVGGINVIYRSIIYHSAIYSVTSFNEVEIRNLLNDNPSFEAASMVPTMLTKLMEDKFFKVQYGFKGLLIGGGHIDINTIDKSVTRGIPIIVSYGMTETCAQIAGNPLLKAGGRYVPKTSVGTVFSPNEVEIRSDNGTPVRYNEPGEIWLKGPQVFDGYLDPNETRNSIDKDGWFRTGDYGHINKNGHLFIENRRTDLIITGGENVNPNEVESEINKMEGISESAVVGIPDGKWGQRVVAYVVKKDGEVPDFDTIEMNLKKNLRGYKIPKEFILVDSLPKTSTLKVKKRVLIDSYLEGEPKV